MLQVDWDLITPSSRNLVQALSTRRRSVALVATVVDSSASELATRRAKARDESARLEGLGVSAIGFAVASLLMRAGAQATTTPPILDLGAISDQDELRRARYCGADGVCISLAEDAGAWARLAPRARTLRMTPVALVNTESDVDRAEQVGARAALLSGPSVDVVLELARRLPKRMMLLADVPGAKVSTLRALRGEVDAAVVSATLHAEPGFEDVVAEVDP